MAIITSNHNQLNLENVNCIKSESLNLKCQFLKQS